MTPSALIDFRSPGGDPAAALRLAFGTPRDTLSAHSLAEVTGVLKRAELFAREGAWCVGHIAYEAAGAFDAALRTRALAESSGPLARFLIFDAPLTPECATEVWDASRGKSARVDWLQRPGRAAFEDAFTRIHNAIGDGELYQVNLTAPLRGELDGDPLALFDALHRAQPNAYAAYIAGDADADTILSVSPELFFDWRAGRLLASPMKGTAPRGATQAEDAALQARLIASEKERAENVMIVDLLRSDLSRVAEPFSVKVLRLFHAEAWPTVWQLISDIECRTRAGVSLVDVFCALFPCGSVTGAPKVQAMRMIRELEAEPRGVYCGAVGIIQPGGNATFNVPIRTLTVRRRQVSCHIGSGITADAEAHAEWQEWRHKQAFVARASTPFELLETLRLDHGHLVDAPAHLARMAGAASNFGFRFDKAQASLALDEIATQHTKGTWRIRLLSDPHAEVRAQAFPLERCLSRVRVQVASVPIADCDGEFFRFKTTRRSHYEAFTPSDTEVFDTLLWNADGEITEFTRGNVAVRIDGQWWTPPLRCGLLPGIARARLLAERRLHEAVLLIDDLMRAEALAFFNSLRGWLDVTLVRCAEDEREAEAQEGSSRPQLSSNHPPPHKA